MRHPVTPARAGEDLIAELIETLRECQEQAEWEMVRGPTPSYPALTRIAAYCREALARAREGGRVG